MRLVLATVLAVLPVPALADCPSFQARLKETQAYFKIGVTAQAGCVLLTKLKDASAGCALSPKDQEFLALQTRRWCDVAKKGLYWKDQMVPE